jgi:glutamate-1-semialdehyde 2,1-aminomutase
MTQTIDRRRLELMLNRERARFAETHPRCARAYARAGECPFGGVPMTWMNKTAAFPLYLDGARRARVIDIDGHEYVDFALGDTGAPRHRGDGGAFARARGGRDPAADRGTGGPDRDDAD